MDVLVGVGGAEVQKISVIIPCYNVEPYIDRCLESVMNQTIGLEWLEVIVVNDASTDNTLKKLYQWEKRFPENIMVISYEQNIRQGGARNIGLQYATGAYIGFVDADDWIAEDMYQELYERISAGKYDVVKCKFVREHFKDELPLKEEQRQDAEYHFIPKKGICYGQVTVCGNCGEYGSICTGLYRRELLKEHDFQFPEGIAYEDNYWESILKLYIKSIYIIDKVMYHYFVNPSSTVMEGDAAHHLERLEIELMKVEELKIRGAFEFYSNEIEWEFIQRFYLNTWYIVFTRFSYVPDIFGEMKKQIVRLFPEYKKNPYLMQANPREQQLLRLLEMEHNFSVEELERIKKLYLASMG